MMGLRAALRRSVAASVRCQWIRRVYPQISQEAVRASSSITRKLVHPLVAQYRRDGCAFAVRRRMRRIALARPTAAFAAFRDSMG